MFSAPFSDKEERMSLHGEESAAAFNPQQWDSYRAKGNGQEGGDYSKLGWVKNADLLNTILQIIKPNGQEIVVDAGAGAGAVWKILAPYVAQVLAFDISEEMIKLSRAEKPENVQVDVGDIYAIKVATEFADVAIARMVFHHLADVPGAVQELVRIIKKGGKAVIIEYVAIDAFVQQFERQVFDIKEKGRHLWTGGELQAELTAQLPNCTVVMEYGNLEQYSVRDWIGKSGLPAEKQEEIFNLYAHLHTHDPDGIIARMNIAFETNEVGEVIDVLVDRQFAHAVIEKN